MKIERLLTMTVMLLNRRKVTAKELAEQFGVTVRTIYRDVETLNASGIPVISYQGYEGGFCIAENFKMSRQLLTFDDILSLLSLLKGVNKTLKNREVAGVIEKITALIPAHREEEYEKHQGSFIIDISSWGNSEKHEQLVTDLQRSVTDSHVVHFTYTSSQGKSTTRTVEPHTMVLKNFVWYLIGYCRLREEFRLFKVSRIRDYNIEKERFVRREVDPHDYFHANGDKRVETTMRLKFSKVIEHQIEEMFWDYIVERNKESIVVECSMPIDNWLYGFILSFAEHCTVLSPSSLQETIAEKINKMNILYSNLT